MSLSKKEVNHLVQIFGSGVQAVVAAITDVVPAITHNSSRFPHGRPETCLVIMQECIDSFVKTKGDNEEE
jgi:hypothetical protein